MVNGVRTSWAVLTLAACVLTAAAWLRGAEYDEQYTLFLTAGTARPTWPEAPFPAGMIAAIQAGHASLAQIARDLRADDVHPPLYFWAIAAWRSLFGPTLFAARMASVLCGIVSLGLVGRIARNCAIRPTAAMLATLGCYGFVYTNAVARGFAPAQTLTLCGFVLLQRRRDGVHVFLAGALFGAASACNYLAVFVGIAVMLAIAKPNVRSILFAAAGALPFAALDAFFFAAQHGARAGQFPPFLVLPSLARLAQYQLAAVFGGLPLYVDGIARFAVSAAITALAFILVAYIRPNRLQITAAVAPAVGLLLLGIVFNNAPIELRYLSFGLPFIGLLIAGCGGIWLRQLTFTVQIASIAGLLLAPQTMQPARLVAREAARLAGDGLVLLPRGNDGVGIVGAFGIESPPALTLRLVHPDDDPATLSGNARRVVLALVAQDRNSRATLPVLRAAVAGPNWRRIAIGSYTEVYARTDAGE